MKEGDAAGLNTSSSERLVGEALWQLILVLKIVKALGIHFWLLESKILSNSVKFKAARGWPNIGK
jgi:hypothetical protein